MLFNACAFHHSSECDPFTCNLYNIRLHHILVGLNKEIHQRKRILGTRTRIPCDRTWIIQFSFLMLLIRVLIVCFTISRRSLLSSFNFVATSTKMEAKKAHSSLRILIHGGDNMLGRAVQLSFPVQAPGEEFIKDSCTASHYLNLCLDHPSGRENDPTLQEIRSMNANHGSYLWGDSREMSITPPPDLRLLNIETAVTKSIDNKDLPLWKGIRYHMHSDNYETAMTGFLSHGGGEQPASSPVVVNFANNHVMDYGRQALEEESIPLFERLQSDDFQTVGVGRNLQEASRPAKIMLQVHVYPIVCILICMFRNAIRLVGN